KLWHGGPRVTQRSSRAQRREEGCVLQPDDSCPDDDQLARQAFEHSKPVSIHNPFIIKWNFRAARWTSAARNHNMFAVDHASFRVALNFDCVRISELRGALKNLHP